MEADERKKKFVVKLNAARVHHIKTGDSINKCCLLFGLHHRTFEKFLKRGAGRSGRPFILTDHETKILKLFLLSLETAMDIQLPIVEVIEWIKKISSHYKANPEHVKVTNVTARQILKRISLHERKSRTSDAGRERVVNETDRFIHFMNVISVCLDRVSHNPCLIWNVDEVGVQLAERKIRLVTGREYLNKETIKCDIHITLTLCTNAFGDLMPPHFLFQNGEGKHLLAETKNSTCDSNTTGFQDESTFQSWLNLFILFKKEFFSQKQILDDKPVILLLDGHYSHLDRKMLYTAALSSIIIVCLPSHATMVVQPNDQTVNKHFKELLSVEGNFAIETVKGKGNISTGICIKSAKCYY